MPRLSARKKEKISEQILHYLFSISPEAQFTSKISDEIARDEEFIKTLLVELKAKSVVVEVKKNSEGTEYSRRQRWRLSTPAYEAYRKHQASFSSSNLSSNSVLGLEK